MELALPGIYYEFRRCVHVTKAPEQVDEIDLTMPQLKCVDMMRDYFGTMSTMEFMQAAVLRITSVRPRKHYESKDLKPDDTMNSLLPSKNIIYIPSGYNRKISMNFVVKLLKSKVQKL